MSAQVSQRPTEETTREREQDGYHVCDDPFGVFPVIYTLFYSRADFVFLFLSKHVFVQSILLGCERISLRKLHDQSFHVRLETSKVQPLVTFMVPTQATD